MFKVYAITGNVGYLHKYDSYDAARDAANHARSRTDYHYMVIRASDEATVYTTI